ncbi:MAG: methanogenesis marker 12 protein [Thermoplasmata archaeon]|nr:MAG: methanogenesis marker 12 protein [Thermoplasmata archaeon]
MECYAGIDHGTRAIRAVVINDNNEVLGRISIKRGAYEPLVPKLYAIANGLKIAMVATTYSMGDAINNIVWARDAENRGVISLYGAGQYVGTGTKVFDELRKSELPVVLVPGAHRGLKSIDRRFRVLYSHYGAPDKVCAAYHAMKDRGLTDFILLAVSANTVTLAIKNRKIVGGIDAPLLAPGLYQGPFDVEKIRIAEKKRANHVFSTAGLLKGKSIASLTTNDIEKIVPSLALGAAMTVSALRPVFEGKNVCVAITYANDLQNTTFMKEFRALVTNKVFEYDEYCAAIGAAEIAMDIHNGKREILGMDVRI